jgi:hypothetical protein
MLLSESYKNRLKELSGLIVCDNCYHSWQKEKEDKDPSLCHVCGFDSEEDEFRVEALKKWLIDKYGSLQEAWSKKYKDSINCKNPKGFSQKAHCKSKSVQENVGPGPYDTVPVSDIYMDIFNQIFVPKDFKRNYNPDNEEFWFQNDYEIKNQKGYSEKKDETADEGDLDKEEVKDIDINFQKMKRAYNWKNFQKLSGH